MICNQLNHVGNHLQSSAMSAADVADFLGISDADLSTGFEVVEVNVFGNGIRELCTGRWWC